MSGILLRSLVALAGAGALALQAGVFPEPVTFTHTTNTALGESLFVVGSTEELGRWNPTGSVKMVATACAGSTCTWETAVAIPRGTEYAYKFIKRNDCNTCYGQNTNVAWEAGPDRTGRTSEPPPAPFSGKTVFYLSGWPEVSILYSNTVTGSFTGVPMQVVGPGRTPGESLWRADGLNSAHDGSLSFVFTDNAGAFDNPGGVAGANYETPLDACWVQDGDVYNYRPADTVSPHRIETFFLNSTNLPGRTVRVYLPRGYDEHTGKRYPVLYMHDGQNLFLNMGTFGSWNADTNATREIRHGRMRETIIVGVDNNPTNRLAEYQPPDCLDGLADDYAALLFSELKPQIDAQYRTRTNAANTGVLGSSMGGLVSIYLGWEFTARVSRVGAMSSAFWRCGATRDKLADPPRRPLRIYLDSGDSGGFTNDGLADTMQARDNLLRNGYVLRADLDHVIGFGHEHNEFWWDKRLPRCLRFLFPTADEPNSVLDSRAHPPRLSAAVRAGGTIAVAWTAYAGRTYRVETTESLTDPNWQTNGAPVPAPGQAWAYPARTGFPGRVGAIRIRQMPADGRPD